MTAYPGMWEIGERFDLSERAADAIINSHHRPGGPACHYDDETTRELQGKGLVSPLGFVTKKGAQVGKAAAAWYFEGVSPDAASTS